MLGVIGFEIVRDVPPSNWSLGSNTRQLQRLSAPCNGGREGQTRGGFLVDVWASFLVRVLMSNVFSSQNPVFAVQHPIFGRHTQLLPSLIFTFSPLIVQLVF